MNTVTVCSKLPYGLILNNPIDPSKTVTLDGANKQKIIGANYGTTEVDSGFWQQWLACHKEYPAIKNGTIFVAKKAGEVEVTARDYESVKTGLEPMQPDALGVKPADK